MDIKTLILSQEQIPLRKSDSFRSLERTPVSKPRIKKISVESSIGLSRKEYVAYWGNLKGLQSLSMSPAIEFTFFRSNSPCLEV